MALKIILLVIIKSIKDLRQQRGAIFIMTALMLPVFFAFMGFAYDMGNLYIHKTRLQNVVDSAALAGGRAFLESQKKEEVEGVVRDDVDEEAGDGKEEKTYVPGRRNINRGRPHPDADNAADDYIYKNIVNLGTTVHSDKYSHLALNSEGSSYKTFYRIGLYEQVPLYFLPIAISRTEQRVRAGAVVLIDRGRIDGQTLFDRLFTVVKNININGDVLSSQDETGKPNSPLDPINPGNNGAKIETTFDGDIVFASDDWNSVKENAKVRQNGGYIYTSSEKSYQSSHNMSVYDLNNIPNTGTKSVWDNTIGIDFYVEGFLKKLTQAHFDLSVCCNSDVATFETTKLNDYKNKDRFKDNHYRVTSSKGTVIYFHENNSIKYPCGRALVPVPLADNTYYYLQKDGNRMFVVDDKGNPIYCIRNDDDTWSFQKNNQLLDNVSPGLVTNEGETYSYNENGKQFSFTIEKEEIDFSPEAAIRVNEREFGNTTVYHWERNDGQPATLKVNGGLSDSEAAPIYIIFTGGSPIRIEVTETNERPIIFSNLTSADTEFVINSGVTFNGIIYSPFSNVNNVQATPGVPGGSFTGSIISKELDIQDIGTSWTQKNFVEGDSDLNSVTEEQATAQKARKQQAIQYAKDYFAENYADLGIDDNAWTSPSWFASQAANKNSIITAWNDARQHLLDTYGLDMPDWPWDEGKKETDGDRLHYSESNDIIVGEKLRIINYRTEYLSDPYINPFTLLEILDED